MTGHLFGDRYQVGDTLGFGGMSEVHRGRDLRLGRDVAIKVLRADLARDPSFQTRFRREAQNAASLNHPAIVAVYDTGETQGETGPIPYIVMEYVDGETLRELLKREGSLAPKRAMEIVADVCAALDFSHRHGIVHRDIKPANVMLTRAGAVKVMDFGIARAVADGQATMTATAAVIGTAQYLSPEQARGEAVDARSDVYATGCVLFELLTGAPPFTGDSPVAVAYQHVREDPRSPSEVKPGLPKELDAIVLKALNKNPLNRYQTAAEMRSDLVRALSGQAVHATPIMSDEERTQIMRPGPVRVGAAALAPAPLLAPPRRSLPEDLWEEEDAPDRSKKVWGFVGIGVLCAVLLAGAIFLTLKVTNRQAQATAVSVPSVAGMSLTDAQKTLQNYGLVVGTTALVESTNADKGKVTKQNPSQGQVVDKGVKVNLEIGKGITAVNVPNLVGNNQAGAKTLLAQNNLVYKEKLVKSDDAHKGQVISQDPAANAQVPPNSAVTVTVGTGPVYATVPDGLINLSFDDAKSKLKAVGLDANPVSIDATNPLNQVLAIVDHKAGETVEAGTVLSLKVSNNRLFIVPSVQNLTVADAGNTLHKAGWNGTANTLAQQTQDVTDRALVGVVTGQSPAAGSPANKLTSIQVVVGKAKQVSVPDFSTVSVGGAAALCNSAGVVCQINQQQQNAPIGQGGKFINQSIPPGTQIDFDQPVVVNFLGPEPPPPTTPKTTPTTPTTTPTTPKTTPTTTPSRPGG